MKPTDSQISPAHTFIVHDSGQVVPAGLTCQITMRPQIQPLRPVWLRIDPEIAPHFSIDDVRVGNRSQFPCAQSVPAMHFMHRGGLDADALPLLALFERAKAWSACTIGQPPGVISAQNETMRAAIAQMQRMMDESEVYWRGSALRGRAFHCETIQIAMDFTMFVTNRSNRDLAFCATWECETVGSLREWQREYGRSAASDRQLAEDVAANLRAENERLRKNLARAEEGWRQAVDTVHEICFGTAKTDAEVRESMLMSARAKLMPTVHCDDSHYQHLSEACPHGYGWKCPHAVNVPAPRTLEEVKQDLAARDLPATNAEAGDHFQFDPTEPGENGAGIVSVPEAVSRERATRCPSFGWDPFGDE